MGLSPPEIRTDDLLMTGRVPKPAEPTKIGPQDGIGANGVLADGGTRVEQSWKGLGLGFGESLTPIWQPGWDRLPLTLI